MINVSSYNVIRKDRLALCHTRNDQRAKIKCGGGICLYLKKDMIYETLNSIKKDCVELELLTVKTSRGGGKKQIITVVYRPPNCNPNIAIDCLRECLTYVNDSHRNCEHTIIGDLNFNHNNVGCPHVKSIKFLEQNYGVRQIIKTPTRFGRNNDSLIDLCITNMDKIAFSGTVDYFLSDHLLIYIVKKHMRPEKKELTFHGRCYKNYVSSITKTFNEGKLDFNFERTKSIPTVENDVAYLYYCS